MIDLRVVFMVGFFALVSRSTKAAVVINEILYHAPNDVADLQYVELYNPTDQPVDLSGWTITKGVRYQFPPNTRIEATGFWVICRDLDRFKEFYGFAASGAFERSLGKTGDRIELLNDRGEKVDSVTYDDSPPWPVGPDGNSASLERISPFAESDLPQNWAASPLSEDGVKPAGTPGKQNANFSANLPPIISEVKFKPVNPTPDQPVTVEAVVQDADGVRELHLRYRIASSGSEGEEALLEMTKVSEHRFTATIPGQKAHQIIRFRIQAADQKGAQRFHPAANEPRPAFSCFVHEKFEPGKIPFGLIINVGEAELKEAVQRRKRPDRGGFSEEVRMRWMGRAMLESGMDVASAWFELTINRQMGFDVVQKLRPVFSTKHSERDKVIESTLDSPTLQDKLKDLPAMVKTFHGNLREAVIPILSEEQNKRFSQWQEQRLASGSEGLTQRGPEFFLKRMLNLEGAYFQLSTRPDFTEPQFLPIRAIYQSAVQDLGELVKAAMVILAQENGWQELQQELDELQDRISKKLKPVLTANQERDFSRWRDENSSFFPGRRAKAPSRPQGRSAFVVVNQRTKEPELFDFVSVTERGGGYKVRFQKDQPFNGMTTINLLFEYHDRFVLAEPLAYDLFRRAGNAAELTDFVRLWIDGELVGYHLLLEQPNRAFLRRNKLKDDGNLYKILWYERGVVRQHEKKTNLHTGHDDLLLLLESLEGDEQWMVIKKHFNVEQVINYFAVTTCLSHWDGFFNNYFTYHDLSGSGKWEMYPWDQDKTWGFYDGIGHDEVFYDMPLTFGMEGDVPPQWPKNRPPPRGFGGGTAWWRPGGYFSKPLLANPQFRKHYLARTKEILETIYTEEIFFPIIDELGDRLKDEVRIRAEASREDPDEASKRLKDNLRSLKDHLVKRRKFLLDQDELRAAG